jgi:uncharacterized membrane protein YfcA
MEVIIFGAIAYLIVGVIAGILGGLLGIGGGIVTVPCLLLLFHLLGYPQPYIMHMALGTSLAAMTLNTISSTWAHHKKEAVLWNIVKQMLPGMILGGILGATCARFLSGVILELLFGVFLIVVGTLFFRQIKPHVKPHQLPSWPVLNAISAGIGWISNMLGMAGGILTMPLLTSFQIPNKKAIGTSAATSFLITLIGAVSYLIVGLGALPVSDTVGFINLPAFVVIGLTTFFVAPYGVKLAHQLPDQVLRRIFGIVLIVVGLSMMI